MSLTKIQKLDNDLIVIIPPEVCEELDIKEGTNIDLEVFRCSGEMGVRFRCRKM